MLRVLEPVSQPRPAKTQTKPLAPRVADLNGKVLGFLSNMWPSVPYTFERFQTLAGERYRVSGVVYLERALTSAPAPAEMINELVTKSDLVFVALGHGGACTTWSVRDAVHLEEKGTPTVTLVSQRFVTLAKHVAKAQGMPDLKIVVVPPEVDFMPKEDLRAVADKAFEEAAAAVSKAVPEPAT